MYKYIKILIFSCVSIVNLIELTFCNYCDTNSKITLALNLGGNIYLGHNSTSIWKFDPNVRQIVDHKLDIKSLFGENSFKWADTGFTFVFDNCDPMIKGQAYCEAINSANHLVVVIGSRKNLSTDPNDSRKYGYSAFRMTDDQTLIPLNDSDDYIAWDLKSSGSLWSSFWIRMSGYLYYHSSVFVKSRNQLIISVFDTSTFSSAYHLMSRKLEDDGQWSEEWTEIAATGFRGMFEINDRVFGFDKKNTVFEFKWSDDNSVSFEQISDLNELLNCFGNSSLWKGMELPVITTSTTTTTTTTTTTQSTLQPESTANSVTNSSRSDGSVQRLAENEILLKKETIHYETTEPEVELLSNLTETSTGFEPQRNQKLEDSPVVEEDTDWSGVFVVAILVLIIAIVIALAIIVRNKSKSRIVYMNTKADESKSAEIPLNNNNDNSEHTKDV